MLIKSGILNYIQVKTTEKISTKELLLSQSTLNITDIVDLLQPIAEALYSEISVIVWGDNSLQPIEYKRKPSKRLKLTENSEYIFRGIYILVSTDGVHILYKSKEEMQVVPGGEIMNRRREDLGGQPPSIPYAMESRITVQLPSRQETTTPSYSILNIGSYPPPEIPFEGAPVGYQNMGNNERTHPLRGTEDEGNSQMTRLGEPPTYIYPQEEYKYDPIPINPK